MGPEGVGFSWGHSLFTPGCLGKNPWCLALSLCSEGMAPDREGKWEQIAQVGGKYNITCAYSTWMKGA